MPQELGHAKYRSGSTAAKAVYSRDARKKLINSRGKLKGVTAVVRQAISTGRLRKSQRLDRALRAAETNFAAVEAQLRLLQKSDEETWERQRVELETAWEDSARSIKNLVSLFADGTLQAKRNT